MANCPRCPSQELTATVLSAGLHALGCSSCDGVLVSLISYRAWRETQDLPISASTMPSSEGVATNNSSACLCPKCRALMSKYRFSPSSANQLDYCAHCQEVWFDQGEWVLIEELSLSKELTQIFTRPWQYSLGQQKIQNTTTARWKTRLGDDFEKLSETKKWLDNHPQRTLVLAYLNTPD